jgi:hypothetical protein
MGAPGFQPKQFKTPKVPPQQVTPSNATFQSGSNQEYLGILESSENKQCYDSLTMEPGKSDCVTGTLVHEEILRWFEQNYGESETKKILFPTGSKAPLRDEPYTIGGKCQGAGYPDIAYLSEKYGVMEIAEIKSANPEEFATGLIDLHHYIEKGNSDETLKKLLGVNSFIPMVPWKFPLPDFLYVIDVFRRQRKFRVMWCAPGIILYKELKNHEDEDKNQSSKESSMKAVNGRKSENKSLEKTEKLKQTAFIESSNTGQRILVFQSPITVEEAANFVWGRREFSNYLLEMPDNTSAQMKTRRFEFMKLNVEAFILLQNKNPQLFREFVNVGSGVYINEPRKLPDWVPSNLREMYESGTIPNGLSIDKWSIELPGGIVSKLIVTRHSDVIEVQRLWPEDYTFYKIYAEKVGQDDAFARRLHSVCIEWNKNLLSLLDDEGVEKYISIDDAIGRLRGINQAITNMVSSAFIPFSLSGVGFLSRPPPSMPSRSPRIPNQTNKNNDKATELLNNAMERAQRQMRVPSKVPLPVR